MLHKKKELIVMRVNGFSTAECVRYAATELVITTVLGILIGVPVGAWLGYRVIRLTEQSFLQMDRTLDARSVIFSILITAVFALVINGIALSKVKDLKLSDAAN
jgi:ABC-type antimicrobial peptide transport system permease subunit